MLKFMRNKLVSIQRRGDDTLVAHGVLDDDIYGLELDVTFRLSDLEITSIAGRWNRWTTPECPRATRFLQEAVGFRPAGNTSQQIYKLVGRKACRHYANLLLECLHTAREAATVIGWEAARSEAPELTLGEFQANQAGTPAAVTTAAAGRVEVTETTPPSERPEKKPKPLRKASSGPVIDLHVHTSPASPCSSAPVAQLIEEAKRIGLDGICLTDHNYTWDPVEVEALRQKHGFLILRGNEILTNQGDMLVFGLDLDIQGIVKLEDLRQSVKEAGGYMVVAHPFRGFLVFGVGQVGLTPEKAMQRPLFQSVDAVEVLNGKVTEAENNFALQVAQGLGLPTTGGSDAHEVIEVGQYATRFAWAIHNESELVEALKAGDYEPVQFRKEAGLL